MSEKYKAFEADAPYFITFTLVEWLPLFSIPVFAEVIIDSVRYCIANKGLAVFAYCIMPSHVHMIVQSRKQPLGAIIRDLKKYTAFRIIEIAEKEQKYNQYLSVFEEKAGAIKRNKYMKVWQDGFHPEIIFSNTFFFQKLNYIHNNPVVDRLVAKPEDYLLSSARNYAGLDAPIEIVMESQQLKRY